MTLNNRPYDAWHENLTVQGVIDHMHFSWNKLVVKINGTYIPPEDCDKATLAENDDLQILHLLAGG